ncbi:hypothetical protein H6F43_15285 [Leptolyngbya sp. FACHB-36]|uniref:hypothetical protein n=1 Tax=Leptolyngbya sp. FACHB-36 TaxID=2692808 RepID=UPI0016819B36|nr:hypothetical protein [Leptolyngbya sp. FACHB-36]MBD2021542.1 hypothetical protein [Leptolyngbya sp. FACHB-36]
MSHLITLDTVNKAISSEKSQRSVLRAGFWTLAIVLGALQALAYRFTIATMDAVAYLDVGDAYARGDWSNAINGYWSPLYSWILGFVFAVLKPTPYWEFPTLKLVNFLIYLGALISFELFLNELLRCRQAIAASTSRETFQIPEWVWLVCGYTLFLWTSLAWIQILTDTPDMLTITMMYIAAAMLLRISMGKLKWSSFVALGVALGFAYLSKAVMFPIALIFLGVTLFAAGNLRRALPRVLVALLVFGLVTGPFVTALSLSKGRFTIGDTGKINYVWFVNPGERLIEDTHWQGSPQYGIPKHPSRKIHDNPVVFEFATPLGGTYPSWTDPSYWYDGIKAKFDLNKQIAVLVKNVQFCTIEFFAFLLIFYLILLALGGRFLPNRAAKQAWWLLLPAAAGLGAYMIGTDLTLTSYDVQPSTRYLAPFIVLLFTGCFLAVRLPDSAIARKRLTIVALVVVLIAHGRLLGYAKSNLEEIRIGPPHMYWETVQALQQMGIQPGDRVAIEGRDTHIPWARLAHVKIVAETQDEERFWVYSAADRASALQAIRETGAKVLVRKRPVIALDAASREGWQRVGKTKYYAYLLQK